MAIPVSELQKIAPSSIIELFELQLVTKLHGSSDVYRFHAGVNAKTTAGNIVWNGNSYTAYPIQADGFEFTTTGSLPRPKLIVANVIGTFTALLAAVNSTSPGNDLIGAQVTRIRTLARYLDAVNFNGNVNPLGTPSPTTEFPREVYFITRKVSENRDTVEFELCSPFDLPGVRAPKRQAIANICQWQYRGSECGYAGTVYYTSDDKLIRTGSGAPSSGLGVNGDYYYDTTNLLYYGPKTAGSWGTGVSKSGGVLTVDLCGKRLSSCNLRFGSLALTGTVAVGSNTLSNLSTSDVAKIQLNRSISGFGIPEGTTVTAKGTTTLTLSAAATGTSTVSGSGTLATNGLSITMVSVSGILPGMAVSGTWLPAGTVVTAVNTTTKVVTLNLTFNPNLRESVVTKTGYYKDFFNTIGKIVFLSGNTTGIAVGDQVSAPGIYVGTTVAAIGTDAYLPAVTLSRPQALGPGNSVTADFYSLVTPTAQTYIFTASQQYAVQPSTALPFGSFPGVGGYIQ